VSVQTVVPLTRNSTFATPTLSVALAVIVTVLVARTIVPFWGLVIVSVGEMTSLGAW